MQCQICKKNDATIHLTEITDGHRTEMHICEQCAHQQGVAVKSQVPINELLSNLLASQPSEEQLFGADEKALNCPNCGFTLEEFSKNAVLGCANDYEVFEKSLLPLIRRAHEGKTVHCGKVPSKLPAEDKIQIELLNLRQQLDAAVSAENYELAAELRDKIANMENKDADSTKS
ncbi:MAG: UvrB/UvrC motif-containing protein [Planctomycetota bacterium]|jgi:protein arginine kinase activator